MSNVRGLGLRYMKGCSVAILTAAVFTLPCILTLRYIPTTRILPTSCNIRRHLEARHQNLGKV
jgi:hypothetical protein